MYSKLLQDGNGFTNKSVISTHFSVFHSVYCLPLKPSQPVCGINILKLTWITDFITIIIRVGPYCAVPSLSFTSIFHRGDRGGDDCWGGGGSEDSRDGEAHPGRAQPPGGGHWRVVWVQGDDSSSLLPLSHRCPLCAVKRILLLHVFFLLKLLNVLKCNTLMTYWLLPHSSFNVYHSTRFIYCS